ncbi:MAG: hypothetical protein BEU05_01905 [Marine Group III euryarchaeote CG-Bathy2]|uniref:Solute-binding protein family 3/N-terminal domain-containing protein n=2 Tax=Methanobacteriati TaxID=3366610 RepID=A0A1J5SPA6_9ARCH|nr:MAG: hypothetical protein BEU05_01905 [Marine Group III euryarchaeote CG-Bathy2]
MGGGDDSGLTQEDVDAAYDEGYAKGVADTAPVSTLDTILARGSMKCGVKESQYGMGYLDSETAVRSGLDIEYCRAVAAAIGLDPNTDIEYVPASSQDRFEKLASGEIDVLIRTTTWTTSRDAELNADFAGMNFYDGQGILIREDAFPAANANNSVSGLDGATICVGTGTTTEGNLQDYFTSHGIAFTAEPVGDAAEATQKFIDGACDAFTGDMSAMVAKKWALDNDPTMSGNATWIAQELLSKEPLGAATRDNDDDWNDVVAWVWYGMITAEEFGITSTNYGTADTSDPGVDRLLNSNLGLGTSANPLAGTWMQAVLGAVGNYGEAYDRSFCDGTGAFANCLIDRAGTANDLAANGGLQFAPPMR